MSFLSTVVETVQTLYGRFETLLALVLAYPPLISYPYVAPILLLLALSWTYFNFFYQPYTIPGIPLFPPNSSTRSALKQYTWYTRKLLWSGLAAYPRSPFQILTRNGPKIIIPPVFIDEIKNDQRLSFGMFMDKDFYGQYPGFEPFGTQSKNDVLRDTVRLKLTQAVFAEGEKLLDGLAEEAKLVVGELFPRNETNTWHKTKFFPQALHIISRLSSYIFVGPRLCRNPQWLQLSASYSHNTFTASTMLKAWPEFMQPYVHLLLLQARNLRAQLVKARSIIQSEVNLRTANHPHTPPEDCITWFQETIEAVDDEAKGYDISVGQMALAAAAIRTTNGVLVNAMYDLCAMPEYLKPLRAEVAAAITAAGWSKEGLAKMPFLDSFLKEVMRLNPLQISLMNRRAKSEVVLSDGTVIPKGAGCTVPTSLMSDPSVYIHPKEFNGRRFMKMKATNGEGSCGKWDLVGTSPEHLAFGYGKNECPGKHFAAAELKICLAVLIMRYDWRLLGNSIERPRAVELFGDMWPNPDVMLEYKPRKREAMEILL